jgi:hypothetical protein
MEDCDYCGASFEEESAYMEHLHAEHDGELSRIDQKRVASTIDDEPIVSTRALVGAGFLLVLAGVFYFAFTTGGGGADGEAFSDDVQQPTNVGSGPGHPHYHGMMTVEVDGNRIDFSQQQYQVQADAFHFESRNGQRWHGHGEDITLEYALETLDIGVTNSTLQFDGVVYDRSEGDTVTYEVNGERVNPETYVLQEGDDVTVVAEKG